MPFVRFIEERRYANRLAIYSGECGNSDTVPLLSLLCSSYLIRMLVSGSMT